MVTSGNLSPEEKLLRLIKGQKHEEPKAGIKAKNGALAVGTALAKGAFFSRLPLRKYLSASYADKIISAFLILASVLLAFSFLYPYIFLQRIRLPKVEAQKGVYEKTGVSSVKDSLEHYLESVRGKNIFSAKNTQGVNTSPMSGAQVQSIKDINVVGIIMGANPQAILEDKKSTKSYYVNKGQFVGEFLVEDIQQGKIIVNFKGQKVELYL